MTGAVRLMMAIGGSPGMPRGIPSASTSGGVPSGITLVNDGSYSISGASAGNWLEPANSTFAANYQVKVDVTAGSIDSGTTGTWQDLSTSRAWQKNSVGTATLTFSYREKASQLPRGSQAGVTITVGP